MLYSSDEEDTSPFKPFTVISNLPDPALGSSRLASKTSHNPALLPSDGDSDEDTRTAVGLVVDHWLVDDMPHPPPNKRTRQNSSCSGSDMDCVEPTLRRRKPTQLKETLSKQKTGNRLSSTQRVKESLADTENRLPSIQRVKESHANRRRDNLFIDDHDVFDNDINTTVYRPTPSDPGPSSNVPTQPPSSSHHTEVSGPLRIRVHINSKSLLIPCPKLELFVYLLLLSLLSYMFAICVLSYYSMKLA